MNDAFWVGVYPGLTTRCWSSWRQTRRDYGLLSVTVSGDTPPHGLWSRLAAGPRVQLAALIVVIGTPLAIAYHLLVWQVFDARYPWSTFLFKPVDHFMDYFHVYLHAELFRPGKSDTMVYSPFAARVRRPR